MEKAPNSSSVLALQPVEQKKAFRAIANKAEVSFTQEKCSLAARDVSVNYFI